MTPPMRPIPMTDALRPANASPLAGSTRVWWAELAGNHLNRNDKAPIGKGDPATLPVENDPIHRIMSARRADICGLTLDQPRIMGILNVTPDSFSDGGLHDTLEAAVARADEMSKDADILDIGGESTRPGAREVPVEQEIARTAPVIRAIRAAGITTPISIDTRKAPVAEAALNAGADMVNDVTALRFDTDMAALVADRQVPVCLMHSVADPETMQDNARYADVLTEVYDHLATRIDTAAAAGIAVDKMIVDPGIGFGKTLEHNVELLQKLSVFHGLGAPILLGASRKRFIGTLAGIAQAGNRMAGSVAVALHAAAQGAHILRVHDTSETRQALSLWLALAHNR